MDNIISTIRAIHAQEEMERSTILAYEDKEKKEELEAVFLNEAIEKTPSDATLLFSKEFSIYNFPAMPSENTIFVQEFSKEEIQLWQNLSEKLDAVNDAVMTANYHGSTLGFIVRLYEAEGEYYASQEFRYGTGDRDDTVYSITEDKAKELFNLYANTFVSQVDKEIQEQRLTVELGAKGMPYLSEKIKDGFLALFNEHTVTQQAKKEFQKLTKQQSTETNSLSFAPATDADLILPENVKANYQLYLEMKPNLSFVDFLCDNFKDEVATAKIEALEGNVMKQLSEWAEKQGSEFAEIFNKLYPSENAENTQKSLEKLGYKGCEIKFNDFLNNKETQAVLQECKEELSQLREKEIEKLRKAKGQENER